MVALGASVSASAKVAWTYLVNAGSLGGISSVTPTVRNALRSVRARIFQRGEGDVATSVQRPSSEFAGVEEERMVPRLVFGGAPSLQEAKDATNELKDALDRFYPSSSTHNRTDGSFGLGQVSSPCLPSNSNHLEGNGCIIADQVVASVPNCAMTAFALLSESPAAQNVVSDIVSDPNVWNAVLENDGLNEFLQTHRIRNIVDADFQSQSNVTEVSDNESQDEIGKSKNGFGDFFEHAKQGVFEMVGNVTTFLLTKLGVSSAKNTSAASTQGSIPSARPNPWGNAPFSGPGSFPSAGPNTGGNAPFPGPGSIPCAMLNTMDLGATFMAFAVMVIMVVILKRL